MFIAMEGLLINGGFAGLRLPKGVKFMAYLEEPT